MATAQETIVTTVTETPDSTIRTEVVHRVYASPRHITPTTTTQTVHRKPDSLLPELPPAPPALAPITTTIPTSVKAVTAIPAVLQAPPQAPTPAEAFPSLSSAHWPQQQHQQHQQHQQRIHHSVSHGALPHGGAGHGSSSSASGSPVLHVSDADRVRAGAVSVPAVAAAAAASTTPTTSTTSTTSSTTATTPLSQQTTATTTSSPKTQRKSFAQAAHGSTVSNMPEFQVEPQDREFYEVLRAFAMDNKATEFSFPPTLSSYQRKRVHALAALFGFGHASVACGGAAGCPPQAADETVVKVTKRRSRRFVPMATILTAPAPAAQHIVPDPDRAWDAEKRAYYEMMRTFVENTKDKEFDFSPALTGQQRRKIHEVAEYIGLDHDTIEDPNSFERARFIRVIRVAPEELHRRREKAQVRTLIN